MRKPTPMTRLAILAISSAALALAACGETPDDGPADVAGESIEGVVEGDALDGSEIEQAVPGVVDAEPEGETGNTADLGEEENVEYTDEAGYDREAKTAAD